ncbi:hypothetical protein [Nocardioides aquiterrae]|uniref:Uncharacterized protein n=1 Tax=Nocardioides aquiterrae TaxID=203799 RepID=A0ABN1UCU9_9ACTN
MTDVTVVEGRHRRPQIELTSFADITGKSVLDIAPCAAGTAVTFDGALTAYEIALVQYRMDSTDAADEAARANLRDLRAAAETGGLDELRAFVLAAFDYWFDQ